MKYIIIIIYSWRNGFLLEDAGIIQKRKKTEHVCNHNDDNELMIYS